MQIVAIDIHGLACGFARPIERRDLGGVRIAITETIGEQQRQTGPSFRALRLANGGELEARERLALPSIGEHSSIVVILQPQSFVVRASAESVRTRSSSASKIGP